MSLRSDNQFNNHAGVNTHEKDNLTSEPNHLLLNPSLSQSSNPETSESNESSPSKQPPSKPHFDVSSKKVFKPKAHFPQRLISKKYYAQLDKVLEVFKQVKINIPLLDAIQQVPSYAKCLKDLSTHKRTTHVPKKALPTSNVSSILSNQISVKYKDPGCPTISCVIGITFIDKALLNFGASVNLLPLSVYQVLGLAELKKNSVTLQFADRSVKTPTGIVEDVLIKIGDFVFPVDFVVLETEPDKNLKNQIPVILGRPFLATSNALINYRNGLMKLTFGNMIIDLKIFNIGKQPNELFDQPINVNMIDELVDNKIMNVDDVLSFYQDYFGQDWDDTSHKNEVNKILESIVPSSNQEVEPFPLPVFEANEFVEASPPELDLKPFPETLKYMLLV
ncbi:uncharacterized protein LOC141674449 [Apium graveolens]|uniref:uncharacterized protein LOC141674449 n=1 Tax=Apium graveolens TaxID=4045 RepID=UPI003D7B1636